MAKFKSLLKKTLVKEASRKRKCYHNSKHSIVKGDKVLEIDSGLKGISGYCTKCASKMIENARKEIDEMEKLLSAFP